MDDSLTKCCHSFQINLRLLLAVVSLTVFVSLPSLAYADENDDDQPALQPQQNQPQFKATSENFARYIFSGLTEAQATKRIDEIVEDRIDDIDLTCRLSDAQKQKLRLAATGDVKRFRDRYEQLKQIWQNTTFGPPDHNSSIAYQALKWQWHAGIFDDESLFKKVLSGTLNQEQRSEYRQDQEKQYQAQVKAAVRIIDRQLLLSDAKRQEFENLLQGTPPPKTFGQFDFYYVMAQAANLPDEKLSSVLNAEQLEILKHICQRAKDEELRLKQRISN